jgi:GMP synthase PP-ATPase subunit
MTTDMITPIPVPTTRILGDATNQRRELLSCIDVVVGYVAARHRIALAGWRLEAALVEDRPDFRGGETVALRAAPLDGRSPADLPPIPFGVLREISSRITDSFAGIANVVPDIASIVPDVAGLFAVIDFDDPWLDDAATA